jgi:hypothetical protein
MYRSVTSYDPLSLQIASGILIAGVVMLMARYAMALWTSGERWPGFYLGAAALMAAGGLIAAGVGLLHW